jgi:hypothetical protein
MCVFLLQNPFSFVLIEVRVLPDMVVEMLLVFICTHILSEEFSCGGGGGEGGCVE